MAVGLWAQGSGFKSVESKPLVEVRPFRGRSLRVRGVSGPHMITSAAP